MSIEPQNETNLADAEAKALLASLLANGLGISGHRRDNGADFYRCSACYATKDTMGFADGNGELNDVDHEEDCGLVKLHRWATKED